jgi:hypothetical protein
LLIFLWCFATNSGFFDEINTKNASKSPKNDPKIEVQATENLGKNSNFDTLIGAPSKTIFEKKQTELSKNLEQNLNKTGSKSDELSVKNQPISAQKNTKLGEVFEDKKLVFPPNNDIKFTNFNQKKEAQNSISSEKIGEKTTDFLPKNEAQNLEGQGSVVLEIVAQLAENQLVTKENSPILKTFFTVERIETRRFFVQYSSIKKPENLLKNKPSWPKVSPVLAGLNRNHFGLEMGFETAKSSNANTRNLSAFSFGIFGERMINNRFSIHYGLDYQWITHLNISDSANSIAGTVVQYKFGVSKISGEYRPISLHLFRPYFALKTKIVGAQWLELGVSERFIWGKYVELFETVRSPFNAVSYQSKKGFSLKYAGIPRFSTETRVAWTSDFGTKMQLSFGWNYQISAIIRPDAGFAKHYSENWLDLRIRYKF